MSTLINNQYLNAHVEMTHCFIEKKIGFCIAYELYEETTNRFIMSCIACPQLTPMIVFLRLQNYHLKHFEEICCNLNIKYYVGRMMPDWMTGYHYTLTGVNGEVLAEIRIKAQLMTSAPIAFTAKITNLDYEADDFANDPFPQSKTNETPVTSTTTVASAILSFLNPNHRAAPLDPKTSTRTTSSTFNLSALLFSCIEEQRLSCLDDPTTELNVKNKPTSNDINHPQLFKQTNHTNQTSATTRDSMNYTSLSENNQNLQFTFISTKKPIWNSEINQWMHFFGGRVKIPSVHNFLAMEVPPIADGSKKTHYYQSAIQDQTSERVCIRHGKIAHNTFILDFRAPASPLIAFAIMIAAHCH